MRNTNNFTCLLCKGRRKVYTTIWTSLKDSDVCTFKTEECIGCLATGKVSERVFLTQIKISPIPLDNLEIVELYEKAKAV